jgi:restriction system protein
MSRKSPQPLLLLKMIVAVVVIWAFSHILSTGFLSTLALLMLISGVAFVLIKVVARERRRDKRQALMLKVNNIVAAKLDALTRRRAQLVQPDAFGKPQMDRWTREINYFIQNHILCQLNMSEQEIFPNVRDEVVRLINEHTYTRTQAEPVFKVFSDQMSPADFEIFCAEQLKTAGWHAEVTMRSRDKGVDIIAQKAGTRVVVQCKLYSGAVGSAAVQEIVAGRAHERAHYGVVVSNNRYTAPAEQLALSNGVLLLHFRDLVKLDTLITARAA